MFLLKKFKLRISLSNLIKLQLLDAKQKKRYEEVQNIMSREKNFQNFRAHLHKADPPCIPYLGLYLTDLTFIEDGNKDFIQEWTWQERS